MTTTRNTGRDYRPDPENPLSRHTVRHHAKEGLRHVNEAIAHLNTAGPYSTGNYRSALAAACQRLSAATFEIGSVAWDKEETV